MSDREAFIRHIAEHPQADLPRLVFADWLDERDDPLGLFIRTQIELDPIRDQIELARTRELLVLEEELIRDHEESWLAPLWDFRQHWESTAGPYFRRGFPHAVCLLADELHEDGERTISAVSRSCGYGTRASAPAHCFTSLRRTGNQAARWNTSNSWAD